MCHHLLKTYPILRPDAQAGKDEIFALAGDGATELDVGRADLFVLLEGDVALHHVVKQDAQGPHGQGVGLVPVAADPFGRGVHSGS